MLYLSRNFECIDFIACDQPTCPAKMFFADKRCSYENITGDFAPGRTRTTITCRNIEWGARAEAEVRLVTVDVVCSRRGSALFGVCEGRTCEPPPPGTCGGATSIGAPISGNEGWEGLTIAGLAANGRGTCADLFGEEPFGLGE